MLKLLKNGETINAEDVFDSIEKLSAKQEEERKLMSERMTILDKKLNHIYSAITEKNASEQEQKKDVLSPVASSIKKVLDNYVENSNVSRDRLRQALVELDQKGGF